MKKWLLRLIVAGVLVGLGFWGWRKFFPGPEEVIQKRLLALASTASFSANEPPLAKLANAQKLTSFCTADIEIAVDVPGRSSQTLSGRDDLLQAAAAARSGVNGLRVEFLDIIVRVAPDKTSAVANLTAKGRVPGEKDFYVQELKFLLKKVGGDWLIYRVETVRTLSHHFPPTNLLARA